MNKFFTHPILKHIKKAKLEVFMIFEQNIYSIHLKDFLPYLKQNTLFNFFERF